MPRFGASPAWSWLVALWALGACGVKPDGPPPSRGSVSYDHLRLAAGWTLRKDGLGQPNAFWADRSGRLGFAAFCARAVPELVIQAIDEGPPAAAEPMSLWIAGRRWTLTSHRSAEAGYVEGRLPFPEGVREELLGAAEVTVEAPNRRKRRAALPAGPELKAVADGCVRAEPRRGVEVAPPAPAP